MVAERNPQVGKAVVTFRELSADERVRDMYERREMARMDFESQKKWALKQMQIEIAKNLLNVGDSVEKVINVTGLTHDEVESLRGEL
jgi:hypothetical protein